MTMRMVLGRRVDQQVQEEVEPHELISSSEVDQIRKTLIETHAEKVVEAMLNPDVRESLERVVKRTFKAATKGNPDVIKYVVRETIGTGVIEEILQDPSITDIGYNGKELIVETNDKKQTFDTNFQISDGYIERLVNKFAHTNNKEFTSKSPIFDGRFQNVRINAVHAQNTAPESGPTMSLRVVRPKLALTEDNFEGFAPMFMYDFLKAAAVVRANMVISGTTGTGKTELHKLISKFIPFDDRILLIEDTPETFMKEMFPEKDVYSWVTSEDVSVTQLIKAGLRNHPVWIMVTETRGSEAYEMIQAVLSGHSIITSLHATEARAIPSRFINMAKMGYELSEEALKQDIRMYFNLGIHIRKAKYNGHVVRYLSEIIEFNPDGDKTVFKQRFVDGVFYFETFDISQELKNRLEESMVEMDFPVNFKSERPLDPSMAWTFESSIPLDKSGRPDHAKIEAMGTTLDVLMGREKKVYNSDEDGLGLDYQTNNDGYIAPETKTSDSLSNAASKKINEVKQRVGKGEKVRTRPSVPTKPKQDDKDIKADVDRIRQSINMTSIIQSETDMQKERSNQQADRGVTQNMSVSDLVNKKRQQLNHKDV
ncbi:CpaF family protein [Salipaludibacillus agaradhaerens]|uniref:CpaF/VirB11 family protein n=1 Tax=Salipaludibacillus agaradhaerens TaxID=76935 RepID=UPI002150A558|nr:CpaF/VirB11 family protein [Salipaludibacillus agaradhaerens]MCR6120732.1 CpaF family protein [Salipaludibacillus agaradhaerens]